MTRAFTGKPTTRKYERPQPNGNIYVFEETKQYDPERKITVTTKTKLLGKKLKGTNEIVPTRLRRRFVNINEEKKDALGEAKATRRHVGMMDIIDHMADESGVDGDVRRCTDRPTADKILSMARYIVCTDSHSLAGIEEWQLMHRLPYEDGINKTIYHRLFKDIGKDETLQQSFFKARLDREGEAGLFLACDSSTSSTYSHLLTSNIARNGFNKDDDGLPTVKYLVLFSLKTKMPVWFTKLPGNVPDSITVKPILEQLKGLGVKKVVLVSDNGYYSISNLGEMMGHGHDFITLAGIDVKWIKDELEKVWNTVQNPAHACPFDIDTNGLSVSVVRDFEWTRTNASSRKGLKPGDKDVVRKRAWLHFFFNPERKLIQDREVKEMLVEARNQLESGTPLSSLLKKTQDLVNGCCNVSVDKSGKTMVSFKDGALEESCRYNGFFVIVTNRRMECFEALKWYRRREEIEDFFRRAKQDALMRHTGTWDQDTLQGRMFVQFVALCLFQHTENRLFDVKDSLLEENGPDGKKTRKVMKDEKELWDWMDERSVIRMLNWFDAKDERTVTLKMKARHWGDAETKRDRMLLAKLGIKL